MTWYEWVGTILAVIWFYSSLFTMIEMEKGNHKFKRWWIISGLIIAIVALTITIIKSI